MTEKFCEKCSNPVNVLTDLAKYSNECSCCEKVWCNDCKIPCINCLNDIFYCDQCHIDYAASCQCCITFDKNANTYFLYFECGKQPRVCRFCEQFTRDKHLHCPC